MDGGTQASGCDRAETGDDMWVDGGTRERGGVARRRASEQRAGGLAAARTRRRGGSSFEHERIGPWAPGQG